jgi:hypothetical protein
MCWRGEVAVKSKGKEEADSQREWQKENKGNGRKKSGGWGGLVSSALYGDGCEDNREAEDAGG